MPSWGPLARPIRSLRRRLPPLNFITAHWLYFIATSLLSALVFWGASTPFGSVSFTDSLFFTVSAITLAGLNPVNLSELNTFQQIMLFALIMLGSAIFVSAFVVHVRRKAFERRFRDVQERERRRRNRTFTRVRTWATKSSRRSDGKTMAAGDEEAGTEKRDLADEPVDEQNIGETLSQSSTPPARRGGPEMNRTTSNLAELAPDGGENADADQQNGYADATKHSAIAFRADTRFTPSTQPHQPIRPRRSSVFSMQGVGARPTTNLRASTSVDLPSYPSVHHRTPTTRSGQPDRRDISQYFDSAVGWISRNSQFHGLSEAERQKLGGCEYRAIEFLAWLVPIYFVLWQLLGCIGCAAWVALNMPGVARANGLNPWWVGAFNAVSAFNNSGMSLLDANMVAFQRSYYLLLTMGLLILAGNTAYPIFLRLIIWCMYKVSSRLAAREEKNQASSEAWAAKTKTLRFLLDHPRRCYTNLFPAQHTWWLALSVFVLNGIDWAAFEILNIGNKDLSTGLPLKYRIIDGLFQAFAVRSGGFYVVTISTLRISLLVLYVVMMYISAYPVVITMRNSNVYEERSLGIYAEDEEASADDDGEGEAAEMADGKGAISRTGTTFLQRAKTFGSHLASLSAAAPVTKTEPINTNFIRHQLRAQLAHDAWFLILSLFLIMIIEAQNFHTSPVVFSVFNFVFEIVSAYGCVGISVGVPYAAYSFSGAWHSLSKLILCVVMLRGRHRGLPVAIDKAVLLPGEAQGEAEEEDGRIRFARTLTRDRMG